MLNRLVFTLLRTRVETLGVTAHLFQALGGNTSLVTLKRKLRAVLSSCGVVLTGMPKVGTTSCQLFPRMLGGPSRPINERCEASHSSVPFSAEKF
jgi:hypothetical protein